MLRKKEKGGAPKAIGEKKKSVAETVGKTANRGAPSPTKIVEWQPRRKSQRVAIIVDEKGGTSGFELVLVDKQGKSGNATSSQASYTVPFSDKCMTTISEVPEQDKLVEQLAGKIYPDCLLDHNAQAEYTSHAKEISDLAVFSRDQEFSGNVLIWKWTSSFAALRFRPWFLTKSY